MVGLWGVPIFGAGVVGLVSAEPQFKFNSRCKAPHIILPILVQFIYIESHFIALNKSYKIGLYL